MNKHHDEICRLANAKADTKIWKYDKDDKEWYLWHAVAWREDVLYVVDDGIWVEERKAYALGKQIQVKISSKHGKWCNLQDNSPIPNWNDKNLEFRAKPDEWCENITKPVLCWVSDEDPSKKDKAVLITLYKKGIKCPFVSTAWEGWKYATPVTCEDIKEK